jgi:hypothetical protein
MSKDLAIDVVPAIVPESPWIVTRKKKEERNFDQIYIFEASPVASSAKRERSQDSDLFSRRICGTFAPAGFAAKGIQDSWGEV